MHLLEGNPNKTTWFFKIMLLNLISRSLLDKSILKVLIHHLFFLHGISSKCANAEVRPGLVNRWGWIVPFFRLKYNRYCSVVEFFIKIVFTGNVNDKKMHGRIWSFMWSKLPRDQSRLTVVTFLFTFLHILVYSDNFCSKV